MKSWRGRVFSGLVSDSTFRFIVVADSHIRHPDDAVADYPSNALMVGRNQYVVELCNQIEAEFVVHLGDIVHPLPVEEAHEPAVRLAASVYADLVHPIYFVPGNHDIGDKPKALVGVPPVASENYAIFEHHWGPAFQSFDVGSHHFVIVDTPVLNSGLGRAEAQRAWLEGDLAGASAAGRRTFMFTHYPPFIRDRRESEHYDNLGEPARSWLLDLIGEHVEAVFSGHVHNFLFNHHDGADLYVLPATGFVRPDYSELASVPPERENGRDDPAKLGFFVVEVTPDSHEVRPLRTHGAIPAARPLPRPLNVSLAPDWVSPIGVTLRHDWMAARAFPTAGLDEFRRKTVRDDSTLLALWEARVADVRIPVGDVTTVERLARLRHLTARGMRFTVRSAGIPDVATLAAINAIGDLGIRWELVVPPADFAAALDAAGTADLPANLRRAIAPVVPTGSAATDHFVSSGFSPLGDGNLERWLALDAHGVFPELVFRAMPSDRVETVVAGAADLVGGVGRGALVNVELPRASESRRFGDDAAVAERVAEAAEAALRHPDVRVFLDGFMDHDRGYYPRHGLIDRRSNPRPALHRLMTEAAGLM